MTTTPSGLQYEDTVVGAGATARADTGSSPGTAALARAARNAGLRLSGLTLTRYAVNVAGARRLARA